MKRTPGYAYVAGIVLGLLAAFAPANLPLQSAPPYAALLASTAIFGVAGFICGALWRCPGWRWGLWIVAPGLLLVTAGLVSSGDLGQFLTDDLPYLATGLVGSALGAVAGVRIRGGVPDAS